MGQKLGSFSEMYPECVIACWDAFLLLLDAENIEWRVQLDAGKKSNVYANYKLQEKTASQDMQICVSWKQFLSADWLFTGYCAVNFQNKAEKPLCFPQSLVHGLLCLNSHVLRDVIWVVFWWDNRQHCRSANNNLPFQLILSLLQAFQANFKLLLVSRERNDREPNSKVNIVILRDVFGVVF